MIHEQAHRQLHPSYEEGKTRDSKVAELQDDDFSRDKFLAVVKRAIPRSGASHEDVDTEASVPPPDRA